ncbi:MAG: RnfH family protein [Pseudohongiellaceae bacterium]
MAVDSGIVGGMISVEVAWAEPGRHWLRELSVPAGTTARQTVIRSGIDDQWPEVDVECAPLGIFSRKLDGRQQPLPDEYMVQPGDRVEIYRPLEVDPKQARRQRAAGRPMIR